MNGSQALTITPLVCKITFMNSSLGFDNHKTTSPLNLLISMKSTTHRTGEIGILAEIVPDRQVN